MGTKSLLYGFHCFFIHPFFVALGWWSAYGFPWDPRLWVCFLVHDWGYWGKPNMDGPEGETHPELGAAIVHWLFDAGSRKQIVLRYDDPAFESKTTRFLDEHCYSAEIGKESATLTRIIKSHRWRNFVLYHSRAYAMKHGATPSKLAVADKLSILITPVWLQLIQFNLTGEIKEYMTAHERRPGLTCGDGLTQREWIERMRQRIRKWKKEHQENHE